MATQTVIPGSTLGNTLSTLLTCADIAPGDEPSYQMCKAIYLFHPLGQKMAEAPIKMAQFLPREITIKDGPEDDLRKAFTEQWVSDGQEHHIRNIATQSRVYGIASVALIAEKEKPSDPIDLKKLATTNISFNVLDPLNTAGSLVLNQDPNALDFQKHKDIRVNGTLYHRSRTVTLMNEQPIYIAYTSSAFGFSGRSVYQRALFPLKSFIQTMVADDMVARKVGLIVATLKMAGSVVDMVMNAAAAFKRRVLQIGQTENVISIGEGETVASLDLTNLDGPLSTSRKHILENVAAAADMPAKLLNNETFAEGFGEGTEDAKAVAAYVDGIRAWMQPLYAFMDMVTQRRAWNEKFYATMQAKYPEQYKNVSYEEAFYQWQNSFAAVWPSLLREPESEQVRVADVKLKAIIAMFQVLEPILDPENKGTLVEWLQNQANNTKELIGSPLNLDIQALMEYEPPQPEMGGEEGEPKPNKPFAANDASVAAFLGAVQPSTKVNDRIANIEKFLRRA